MDADRLLTRVEAAKYLGISPITLANWVSTKRQVVPCVKIGRLVRYRLSDLEAFVESRRVAAK